jgi:hypothetical protein
MKMVKSLVLGSAAALVAMSGAQAADLPVKAKAVEYVRICSLYGAGFFYIPGTDTCIKLGGYLRVDTTFNGGIYNQPAWNGSLGTGDRTRDNWASRSRLALTVDTRTATEYGVVRTFGQLDWNTNTDNGAAGGGEISVEFGFIQFAGFTFGRSASAYATPWHGYPGNNSSFLVGGHDTVTGTNNIQYSAQFGNGVSATIGLDDPLFFNRTSLLNLGNSAVVNTVTPTAIASTPLQQLVPAGLSTVGVGTDAYGGSYMPDVVGNIRIDQAWGLFQLSGAVHEVRATYNAATSLNSGHPDSKYGGSVMAALQIKNIPTGPGDDIKIDGSWSKGDMKNIFGTSAGAANFLMLGGVPGQFGSNNSLGFGTLSDGLFLPVAAGGDGQIHLTEGFGMRGAFNHNWDPYWSTSLFGGAMWVNYDNTAKAEYCTAYTNALLAPKNGTQNRLNADFHCDPNYSLSMVGAVTRWTPVKNLTFSGEVIWTHLNTSFSGSAFFSPGAPQPQQNWSYQNQDTLSFNVRAQRNF